MPKKKVDEPTNKAEAPAPAVDNTKVDEEEDAPVIKTLKDIDVKYCAIETEFEREAEKMRKKFREENKHLLEERSKLLNDTSSSPAEDKEFGTPACKGFWLQAFQNCEEFSDKLEKWDEPVLEYLEDVKTCDLDAEHERKGTKLEFCFKENPFFSNKVLTVEIIYDYDPELFRPWQELKCREVKCNAIDWKAGKNVTVEITQKKTKGGGAKKAKQKGKGKEEPRASFFRFPFVNLKLGEPFPQSLAHMIDREEDDDDDDDDDEEKVEYFLMCASELCEVIDERITKYAVRYYTGEAGDDEDDFSEDGEEESRDGDDSSDEDSVEDEPPARGRGKAKAKATKSGGGEGKEGKKEEECKQQ